MATSVATVKYGNYTFNPVPQFGIRDSIKRIGESGFGPGNAERSVTLKGKLYGNSLNEVQTAVWALKAELAKEGQIFYLHDGVALRVNAIAQPISIEIPEDWGTFETDYSIHLTYIPLGETHYAPVSVSYRGYTFDPIPTLSRELVVNRDTADTVTRQGATVTLTLQGFIDKGSVSANFTELNALTSAFAVDGTLTYGSLIQSVRVQKITTPADIGDRRLSYTISVVYNAQLPSDGVVKMSSSRRIDNSYRLAIHTIPFMDDAIVQQVGRNGQIIVATGYVVADTMAHARDAALAEVERQIPNGGIDQTRQITEKDSDYRVEWNVTVFYPTPNLTGGIYGGSPVF